jgi:uncharacterized protein (DUF58 family)
MRYIAGIALLLLIGLTTGATLLAYSAIGMIAIFAISHFLARKWSDSISIRRQLMSHEIEVDQRLQVAIAITNTSRWFVPWVIIEDVLPPRSIRLPPRALEIDGAPLRLIMLASKKHRLLTYAIKALRRGYYQIGPTIVETGDLLGLHRRYRVATEPHFLLVLPKLIPLAGYDVSSKRPIGEIQVAYRTMEDPTLLSSIREYQIGDPMNRVHWRATARTGKLHSKVFQPTSVAGAMLLLDMHCKSNPDHHEPNRTDLAITAAASIAHTLYLMKQQFGLATNGRDAADRIRTEGWETDYRSRDAVMKMTQREQVNSRLRPIVVPCNRGPQQFQEIHRMLARLERTDGLEFPELLTEIQSRLPRDASIIVIVQQVEDQTSLALGMLAQQGYAVSAIVNQYDQQAVHGATAMLLSQRIPVYHLHDESSIPGLCQKILLKY